MIAKDGFAATGGSDSHLVSLIGLCATKFSACIKTIDDLVRELKTGNSSPWISPRDANQCRMQSRWRLGNAEIETTSKMAVKYDPALDQQDV